MSNHEHVLLLVYYSSQFYVLHCKLQPLLSCLWCGWLSMQNLINMFDDMGYPFISIYGRIPLVASWNWSYRDVPVFPMLL